MTLATTRTFSVISVASAVCMFGLSIAFAVTAAAADNTPKLNNQYFGKMPRAWVEVVNVDPDKKLLQVRTKTGELRDVFIGPDTTIRIRDSYGELSDLFPGESVMLFICHDAQMNWVFPRAVQDELQMMSSHGWQWTVDSLDRKKGLVELSRNEKGKEAEKVFHESFRVSDMTKVWKGEKPSGFEALAVGDVVLFQTRYLPVDIELIGGLFLPSVVMTVE